MIKGKPFVKWAGGKRQIIDKLKQYIPNSFNTYYEPFVGGGALFFELSPKKAVINDCNKELMNVFECIKNKQKFIKMCKELDDYEANHSKEFYYTIRNKDRDKIKYKKMPDYKKAARTIYLNKACFNGLYRVNSKNEFNVPFNQKNKINTYDLQNLEIIHSYLNSNDVVILNEDFEVAIESAQKGDFIYFDPPYDSDTTTFNSYTEEGFKKEDQIRLAKAFKELADKGCYVMLSNHNTTLVNELYKDYNIYVIEAKRNINSNGKKRGTVEEVIITNYENSNYKKRGVLKLKRSFNEWFNKFKSSISDYTYYVDFEKVYKNVDKIKIKLNILNSLIGSQNIEKEFRDILNDYPETLECIPLLLAIRSSEIFIKDAACEYLFKFNKMVYSSDDYVKFMRESGLFDLLQNHIINNLYDYVLGIEVGLDSNGRKNRGGHLMENLVESYIIKAGFIKGETYFKEMYIWDIEKKWNLNLSAMSGNNVSTKRFDFVIKTNNELYVIETNFYSSSGSKLNETARSYKMLAEGAKKIPGVTFIWFTDGVGWMNAKKNLEETFNELETLYNIDDLENGILEELK